VVSTFSSACRAVRMHCCHLSILILSQEVSRDNALHYAGILRKIILIFIARKHSTVTDSTILSVWGDWKCETWKCGTIARLEIAEQAAMESQTNVL